MLHYIILFTWHVYSRVGLCSCLVQLENPNLQLLNTKHGIRYRKIVAACSGWF